MAMLLSLALPGLGSIRQGRWLWGLALMVFGFGAFVWTLWRIFVHLQMVLVTDRPQLLQLLIEAGFGIALVVVIYLIDLAAVWVRRNTLIPL
jgi:hypothetical protein